LAVRDYDDDDEDDEDDEEDDDGERRRVRRIFPRAREKTRLRRRRALAPAPDGLVAPL
jgi:hypothetical protein